MPSDQITVRAIEPADSVAVAMLSAAASTTTRGLIRSRVHLPPDWAAAALSKGAIGVTAETPGHDGLIGMGWMNLGQCWYEGALRPFAYLYSAVMLPAYRGRRILGQLAAWRFALAREHFGQEVVAFALVSQGNRSSQAAVSRWSTQRVDGRLVTAITSMRSQPPRPLKGIQVRPVTAADAQARAELEDEFYAGYNFYRANAVRGPLAFGAEGEGQRSTAGLVAADSQGRLLAGMLLSDSGDYMPVRVESMAWPARLANLVLKLIPPDGLVKPVRVSDYWYASGHERAAAHLWESARWLWRARGTTLSIRFDSGTSLARVVPVSRLIPRRNTVLFVAAPVPLQESRPISVEHY